MKRAAPTEMIIPISSLLGGSLRLLLFLTLEKKMPTIITSK
jgi:hypothetical protein